MPLLVCIGPRHDIVFATGDWLALHGGTRPQLAIQQSHGIIVPVLRAMFDRVLRSGQELQVGDLSFAGETERHFGITVRRWQDGARRGVVVVGQELTDHVQERRRLRDAEAKLALASEHLAMMRRLSAQLARVADAMDVARMMLDEARNALGAGCGAVLLVRGDELPVLHDTGMLPGGELSARDRQLALNVAHNNRPEFLPPRRGDSRTGACSPSAVLPLHCRDRTVGVLLLGHFPRERRDLALSLAGVGALALDRMDLLDTERQARREAERANRFKDAVLAVVSHELRAPLSAIMMWDTTLRSPRATRAMRRRAAAAILESAQQQARVIEDLLDATRASRGSIRLTCAAVQAADVVRTAVDTARPAAQARGLHLTVHVDPRPAVLHGDRARLLQVLGNLLHNAIKFTPAGGRVDVSLVRLERALRIAVSDTGCGIEPARLPSIFDAFTSGTPQNGGGLGLGLTIAFELVRLHGGVLEAQSLGLERGSTFVITLPCTAARVAGGRSRGSRCPGQALAGRCIAVLAPAAGLRRGLTSALRLAGAKVRSCADRRVLLRALAARRHDALVVDIDASGPPGPLLRELRAGPGTPPFVLGLGERFARSRRHHDVRLDACLTKPAAAAAVIEALARKLT